MPVGSGSISFPQPKTETVPYDAPPTLPTSTLSSSLLPASQAPMIAAAAASLPSSVAAHENDKAEKCSICLDSLFSEAAVQIKKCCHHFHRTCILDSLSHNPRCPTCRAVVGKPQGRCPSGTMTIKTIRSVCPGFSPPGTNTIQIDYEIPSGRQLPCHENPGTRFSGAWRTAYLPNNDDGRQLLARLKYSFMHGLAFTVGTSLTSGVTNTVTWTSIHHKTSLNSGGHHSFPDPYYMDNTNGTLDGLNVPQPGSCGPYDNALHNVTYEKLQYCAPTSTATGSTFLDELQAFAPPGGTTVQYSPLQPTAPPGERDHNASLPSPQQGQCPSGTMSINVIETDCPGFTNSDGGNSTTIQIVYQIPGGIQHSYHQNPGLPYPSTTRYCYLPNNDDGRALLLRLKYAWKLGMIFKIGWSITNRANNLVVWSGVIPHKTSLRGGGPYGFPDPNYVDQCNSKLDSLLVPSAAALCMGA